MLAISSPTSRVGRALQSTLAAATLVAVTGCRPPETAVVIGVAGPFATAYGASMRQGVELAARDINAAGGIDGRPLELRFVDDQANPERALTVAQQLYDDPEVVAVVGHVNTGAMIQAGSVYDRGLPAVATSATGVLVSRLGDWVFRVAPSDSAIAARLARVARERAGSTAILYENEDYGRGLADAFQGGLKAAGGSVRSVDPYVPTTPDFRPFLERMKAQQVELVLVAGLQVEAGRIIDQAREVGLGAEFVGGHGLEGLATMGSAYDGTLVGVLYHPEASPAASSFAAQFRAAFGREPDSFAALGYDALRLVTEAARESGPERASIRDHLAGVGRDGRPAYQGVTGQIRFDENGDPVEKPFAVGMVREGGVVLVEEWQR